MIHALIAIKDAKVGAFSKPVAVPTAAAGVRAFADAVNDPSTEYAKHPEDYSVWHIGDFNDNTGQFISVKHSELALAVALLKNFA